MAKIYKGRSLGIFMKKTILIFIALAFIGLGLWISVGSPNDVSAPTQTPYRSEKLGVAFLVPSGYFVNVVEAGNGERSHSAIVLMEDTKENRDLVTGKAGPGREAPPTITIGVFQNNLDSYTAKTFVEGTGDSNFKLSDGVLTDVVVGGESGLRYRATGLYENENVVVARPAFVYMFSVSYLERNDGMLDRFEQVLKTVEFLKPEAPAEVVIACDEKRAEMCAQVYAPVCATVNIQCIRAPCYPIKETFSNSCEACRNSLVPSYTAGACKEE